MKTIADIKRKMKVGSIWHTTYEVTGADMGIRTVSVVQSNSFAFKSLKSGENSWCNWPKKDEVTFYPENENKFSISHDGKMFLTYTLMEEAK